MVRSLCFSERSRAAEVAAHYNFISYEFKDNSSLPRTETPHYGVLPILPPCAWYQSIDPSTKGTASYEPSNSGIYEELDFGTLSNGQVYETPGKGKVDVEYLELVSDASLLTDKPDEYLEPLNADNDSPTGNTEHNGKVDPEYFELSDDTDFPFENNSSIVYEIPY